MFYIVETQQSLNRLTNHCQRGCYIEVITSNDERHSKLTSPVCIFIQPLELDQGYIIPIDHPEGLPSFNESVSEVITSLPQIYTLDRKKFLYHFQNNNVIDISLLYSMVYFKKLDSYVSDSTINWYYSKYSNLSEVNKLIPLSILHRKSQQLCNKVIEITKLEIPSGFEFYNVLSTNVFYLLEQNGVGIYYEAFNKMFTPKNPLNNTIDNKVYTSYNLYNSTSRPTNAFNSVNFAAIPKTEEHRKCFKPQNDYFVEFDFDGYHLRLLSEQIGYELTQESAHKQLARLYFEKEEVTEEEYSQAKQINFQAIYGKIPEEHKDLKIFKDIQDYINGMWNEYKSNGVVYNPISKKPFTKELQEMHPQKLMNYMMQSLETSRNVLILKELLSYLKDKKTKIVLFIYDAFIFDFSKEDGKEVLDGIKTIMEQKGKYPVKFKYGENLV